MEENFEIIEKVILNRAWSGESYFTTRMMRKISSCSKTDEQFFT